MREEIFITNSYGETQKLGEDFAKKLQGGDVIALYGELGSGKTTFAQGLARGLGIKQRIISPTFVIVREYKLKTQKSKVKTTIKNSKLFYHVDLYRIESSKEIEGLGLQEIISGRQNIVAIEWAEKIKELLPKERIDIYFEYIDEQKRRITRFAARRAIK